MTHSRNRLASSSEVAWSTGRLSATMPPNAETGSQARLVEALATRPLAEVASEPWIAGPLAPLLERHFRWLPDHRRFVLPDGRLNMPPEPVSSPDRRFVATRIDNGVETNIISSTPLGPNYTIDNVLRGQMYQNVVDWLAANPTVHVRLYGPTSGGAHSDTDCVWDSAICGPLL